MTENTTITISKDQHNDVITTNGYLVIYLKGEEFKFTGSINMKDLAPLLLKIAVEKMSNKG